jgi:predicted dehydrogenase
MTLRIGILGAARVATYAMIDAAHQIDGVTVQAVAARDPARASNYAVEHHIPQVYPDYQALIEANDVDAVYVALPPNLHARRSLAVVEAGKPVPTRGEDSLNTIRLLSAIRDKAAEE